MKQAVYYVHMYMYRHIYIIIHKGRKGGYDPAELRASFRLSLEKGSYQQRVTLNTVSIYPFTQTADPNPFRGTHCIIL